MSVFPKNAHRIRLQAAVNTISLERLSQHLRGTRSNNTVSLWQDLISDLKGELTGKFEDLIVGLMTAPIAYDAQSLHKAIKVGATVAWDYRLSSFSCSINEEFLHAEVNFISQDNWKLKRQVCDISLFDL